jgi:hypothetical protein
MIEDILEYHDGKPPIHDSMFELLDAYLCWNGIIGYTQQILGAVTTLQKYPSWEALNGLPTKE